VILGRSSLYDATRYVTKPEYFYLWKPSIELDNFDSVELARGLTEASNGAYVFEADEVDTVIRGGDGDPLSRLFRERTQHGLTKPRFLKILLGYVIDNISNDETVGREFPDGSGPRRPIVNVMLQIRNLAFDNFPPASESIREQNVASGAFGVLVGPSE
jgi:hypothetical protein